ncbi:MAG: 2-oxo-4-hydroxy-4-carboxy-5-ureidoimidazoline decarboxylase [Synechococcales cyanobacterium RM1_1_8]|nr:2-oxo-4-hydroxy-4-carboxy-5-ureidoimidazoline decarboxylase [Synechococcales cyanobacterium RM1_1_8]
MALLGPVFEETPSIAEATWLQRPFATKAALYEAMVGVMTSLDPAQQLDLIRAHPDLGAKAAMAEASVQEQSSVGLDQLSGSEFERFQSLNNAYKTTFGFPFIIAVKYHDKSSILDAFEQRLRQSQAVEQDNALAEIAKIAWLRLDGLIVDE